MAEESRRTDIPAPEPLGVFEADAGGRMFFLDGVRPDNDGDVRSAWLETVHPDDREQVIDEWENKLKPGEPFVIEYRATSLLPEGTGSRVHRLQATPVPGNERSGGRSHIGVILDVSESRATAEELRDIEERFWSSFENSPIGVALVDLDGGWIRVNDTFSTMLGYTEQELLEKNFQEITHPDDLDIDITMVEKTLRGELRNYELEKRYIRADGKVIWGLLSVTLVTGSDGEPAYFVSQVQDITERRRHERELHYLTSHDVLTGLSNRRHLANETDRLFAKRRMGGEEFALVMLDLDHFKYINDTLGHRAGDDVLRDVGACISKVLRGDDLVARLGGDEFACLLPGADEATATAAAKRLLEAIRKLQIVVDDRRLQVTASTGIACTVTGGLDDEGRLMAAADLAMYEAKDDGRDRYAIHAAGNISRHRATARLNWSNRIRKALDNDSFLLHYQPILDVRNPGKHRAEALIRLADEPGAGLVLPGTFVYIAERFGLMPQIDRWVLRSVFRSIASGALPSDAEISINVSARSMLDDDLLEFVRAELARWTVDPQQICFEVTETAAISKLDVAQRFAVGVSELGCGFALDDFGTGFASFSQLKHLPYGYLKIDGDFVRNVTTSAEDRAMIEALVHVANATGKRTVAEYVGDRATLELLVSLGVDMAQGYFVSEPVPLEKLPAVWSSLPALTTIPTP